MQAWENQSYLATQNTPVHIMVCISPILYVLCLMECYYYVMRLFVASYVTMHVSNQMINHYYIGVIIMIFVYNNYVVSVAEQLAMSDKAAQLS